MERRHTAVGWRETWSWLTRAIKFHYVLPSSIQIYYIKYILIARVGYDWVFFCLIAVCLCFIGLFISVKLSNFKYILEYIF